MPKYRFEQIAINSTEKKKPTEEDRFTYLGLEHLDSGSLKVTRFGSDVAPIGEKLVMREGDVLFGKRRAYQKKVAIAPFDGIFSAHGMVLRPREDVIDKDFFPLFISSDYFLDAAIKISVGSLSPTINWRDLRNLEFNLPPLEEQRKLAKVLWAMNNTMEAYKKLIKATEELVKSQFIALFGDLIENTKGWSFVPLSTICDVRDGTHDSPKACKAGYPLLTSKNFTNGFVDFQNSYLISEADFLAINKRSKVDRGDIVMPMIGTIGNPVIVDTDVQFAIKNVALTKFSQSSPSNIFIQKVLDSEYFKKIIGQRNRGNTQKFIALSDIRNLGVPVVPEALQQQFVLFVQQSDKSKLSEYFACLCLILLIEQIQKSFSNQIRPDLPFFDTCDKINTSETKR